MRKIINNPERVVQEMVAGIAAAHPGDIRRIPGSTVIVRKDAPTEGKVGIVSGGGSGHEPAHAGYVGKGMLDAAVAGEVFTAPTPDQILEAIKATDAGKGVLLIIKNYTGDIMNFEMASEMAEAEGIQVRQVVVNDDVAVEDSTATIGRRGIAGTVFVHKIAGAKAEEGGTLEEIRATADKAVANVRSMGLALTPCIVPASGKPSFTLDDDEMEVGIGIHGEPGIERKPIETADRIALELTDRVLADLDFDGNDVAVMVNGMGATPEMELYIILKEVHTLLADRGVGIHQTFVGNYMTSLEMTGCSITLLKMDGELKPLLDASSEAPAFKMPRKNT